MVLHIAPHRFAVSAPEQAQVNDAPTRNRLVRILVVAILISSAVVIVRPGPRTAPSPALQSAVARSLGDDELESSGRLVSATMTGWGDVEIEFVVQDLGNAAANRAAALADVLAITRSVYQAPEPRPANVTLLAVSRHEPTASPVPVMYASLPADRLAGLDWSLVQAADLSRLGGVRWLPVGLCQAWQDCGAGPPSP